MLIKKHFLPLLCSVLFTATAANFSVAQTQSIKTLKVSDGSLMDGGIPVTYNPDALIDMQSSNRGLLLPRVELQSTQLPAPLNKFVAGMVVYNTAVNGASPSNVTPGYYYCDGSQWVSVKGGGNAWFYVPASLINTTIANGKTFSIYDSCVAATTTRAVASASAPAFSVIQPITGTKTDYHYYVLGYSPDVFANLSIDANGMLTYDVIGEATDETYINIVMIKI